MTEEKAMILLQNRCAYSGLSVVPSNWEKPKAPIRRKWYIHYFFYSPDCLEGKLKIIKSGINRIKDRVQRQEGVKALLK